MINILLPVYNEEENILDLLINLQKFWIDKNIDHLVKIIIVDDGSNDKTPEIIKEFCKKVEFLKYQNFKIKYIQHPDNYGLGVAIKSGFEFTINQETTDKDILITMDGDNSHRVEQIESIIENINNGHRIVICSRYVEGNLIKGVPLLRVVIANLGSFIFKIFFPIENVKDYTCGYRGYNIKYLQQVCQKYENMFSEKGFTCQADILIKYFMFDKKINAREIPIKLRYDLKKGSSKMRLIENIIATLKLILKRKLNFLN